MGESHTLIGGVETADLLDGEKIIVQVVEYGACIEDVFVFSDGQKALNNEAALRKEYEITPEDAEQMAEDGTAIHVYEVVINDTDKKEHATLLISTAK